MSIDRFDIYHRLHPARPARNLEQGFRADVADPLWMLGKQWLVGEHQGEDAASPTRAHFQVETQPIEHDQFDPSLIPPEAVIEREHDNWWTPGRRVRIGQTIAGSSAQLPSLDSPEGQELALRNLPAPYQYLNGRGYDGRALFEQREPLSLSLATFFQGIPTDPTDAWNSETLHYEERFTLGNRELVVPRHRGGHVDWYSADATGSAGPQGHQEQRNTLIGQLDYPGAPHPRWWQIEDAHTDPGGFAPDRAHMATMLLVDMLVRHSSDWFFFPIDGMSSQSVELSDVVIHDCFGDTWEIAPPPDWHLFKTKGLPVNTLLIWPSVHTPLSGQPLEQVSLGIDEDANMVWAVERRLGGRDVATASLEETLQEPNAEQSPIDGSGRQHYRYLTSRGTRPNWHPYVISDVDGKRRLIQGRLADLSVSPASLMPEAMARVLQNPHATAQEPVHAIDPTEIPSNGLQLERRAMLARATDGSPVLWIQRHRQPLAGHPNSQLAFDALVQEHDGRSSNGS